MDTGLLCTVPTRVDSTSHRFIVRRPQHGFSVSYQGVGTLMTSAVSTPTGVTIRDSHLTSLKGWGWATASVTWLTGRQGMWGLHSLLAPSGKPT